MKLFQHDDPMASICCVVVNYDKPVKEQNMLHSNLIISGWEFKEIIDL